MDNPKTLMALGYFAVAAYLVIGVVGGLLLSHWESVGGSDQALWVGLMVGGALVLFIGLRVFPRSPWGGATLISLGGFFGALPIFWTGVALVLGVVLVVLAVRNARRATKVTGSAD